MLIRNSMDMLAPPRTPGMFAGLGAVPADVWNQSPSEVQQFFNSEFSWWAGFNPVRGQTDQFGVTVYYIDYGSMIAALDNQIQVQTELNLGNRRSYQYALDNPIVGGDPDIWLSAVKDGETKLQVLIARKEKLTSYESQQQTGYQAWLLSQWEAREAARLAEIDARVAAMQQSQARSRAETEARNVVLAAEDAARNAAIIQQIMDDAAARGAAALAQQTSARDANVVEVLNRRAAGEDLVSVAVDFIRSLGLGPATDVFLAALTGADPGAVLRDIIEPANVIVTGVRSEPIVVVQAVQEVAQTAAVAATQAAELAVASGDQAAAAVATAAAVAATNAANAASSATTVQTAASAAATAQQAAQTATTAAQTATAAEKGVPLSELPTLEATVAAIRAQVQMQYPGWNPDRMTMDYQPGDELFSRLLRQAGLDSLEWGPSDKRRSAAGGATMTTTTTTGGPAMLTLPENIASLTPGQKAFLYLSLLFDAKLRDSQIRTAVEAKLGPQSDDSWGALQKLAFGDFTGDQAAISGFIRYNVMKGTPLSELRKQIGDMNRRDITDAEWSQFVASDLFKMPFVFGGKGAIATATGAGAAAAAGAGGGAGLLVAAAAAAFFLLG